MGTKMFEANYKYFVENKEDFFKEYKNQYIVINNEEVIFNSSDIDKIVEFTKNLTLGTFIIQKCERDGTVMYTSRVGKNERSEKSGIHC